MPAGITPPERAASIIGYLMRDDYAVAGLTRTLGLRDKHSGRILKYVRALHDLGIVYVTDWTKTGCPIYRLQAIAFEHDDEPKPLAISTIKRHARAERIACNIRAAL